MFNKILFATDVSPECDLAAKTAFELSQKYGSELILVHVDADVSNSSGLFFPDMPVIKTRVFGPEYMAWVIEGLKKRYGQWGKKKIQPDYRVLKGEPSQEILKLALADQVDCIIMGVQGREKVPFGASSRRTAGKTLQRVAQMAECPVLSIARPCETSFWYFNQIVFGADFSETSMAAFQFSYKLADYIGCKLHLFHALKLDPCISRPIPSQKQIEDQIDEAKARIEAQYVSQMHNFDNYHISVWEGSPAVEILKFAREKSSDLIVMGHHDQKRNSEEVFFGHTIEQVVLRSACPVISVNCH